MDAVPAVRLACRAYGRGKPVLLLHGLFGAAAQWHHIAVRLAQHHHVLAVDLRNHGASPHTAAMDYLQMSEDLCALLDAQGLPQAAIVGHSMGGKLAMAFALRHPRRTRCLAVVDIAPVRYADDFSPLIRVAQGVDLSRVERREDAHAQLARHVAAPQVRAMLLQNLVRRGAGWAWRIHWQGIAGSLEALLDFAVEPATGAPQVPALFIAGDMSDYVPARHEPAIRALFPGAAIERVARAGHWLHVDQPGALAQRLDDWLRRPSSTQGPA